jgi:hypothetical protein
LSSVASFLSYNSRKAILNGKTMQKAFLLQLMARFFGVQLGGVRVRGRCQATHAYVHTNLSLVRAAEILRFFQVMQIM